MSVRSRGTALCAAACALALAGPASASGIAALSTPLTGSWNCTYNQGGTHLAYRATYVPAMAGTGLRQTDLFAAGGGDEGMYSYVTKTHRWSAVFMLGTGDTTIFSAADTGPAHIAYTSVYPDKSMREVFDLISPAEYHVHFTQTTGGKQTSSFDVCKKA